MFIIRTRVGPSAIHGTGVFAEEAAMAGNMIWRFDPVFDRVVSQAEFEAAPATTRQFLEMYAYRALDLDNSWVLSGDHARFLNHSDHPNTIERPFESHAAHDIAVGDEITCDYGAFCADWDPADLIQSTAARSMPHDGLYTRMGRGKVGVGVIAIRDIPEGEVLFVGDAGETTRVPIADVYAIDDAEIRHMYLDFCPEQDGAFIAPANFNQLTMGWHLNHSNEPNVRVGPDMRFFASRPIFKGEELTTNYASYSESARRLIETWKV